MPNWLKLTILVIMIDQLTKYWAEHILRDGVIKILPVFDLSLVHNTGAAFGFLSQYGGWQQVFFSSLALGVSILLAFWITRLQNHENHLRIAYALIIAGALGNAIDRVIYQYVIDFIHWYYQSWHFPHFNVADIAIFIGAVLLFADAFGKPFLNTQSTSS